MNISDTYSTCDKKRISESDEGKLEEMESRFEIDSFKKFQCYCNLMRLMEHPDAKDFNKGFALGSIIPKSNPMEIIKSKLQKDMYSGTDEFATDIRLMFSDAILSYPPNHMMHRTAKQLQELFEKRWKSLKEHWETEKQEEEEYSCGEEVCDNFSISLN